LAVWEALSGPRELVTRETRLTHFSATLGRWVQTRYGKDSWKFSRRHSVKEF